jgi:hypothetical protein
MQWEAVEAKIWKQAAATALQKIHEQVHMRHACAYIQTLYHGTINMPWRR